MVCPPADPAGHSSNWLGCPGGAVEPRPHLLLLQADHRAVAAAAPLPLKCRNLLCLDLQDLLLLLVLQLQLLGTKFRVSPAGRALWGTSVLPQPAIPKAHRSAFPLQDNPAQHPPASQTQGFWTPYLVHLTEFSP